MNQGFDQRVAGNGAAPVGTIGIGAVLAGRYRLISRVGAGGMATIFRAHDDTLDRDVAVKVLHDHLADDPSLLLRFRTEARHAASLMHPHIVNVFDQGVAELPYIVMEFVDGLSLREVLRDRERLSPGETLAVIDPVCAGLTRAHADGVIHRDVKPENVLIAARDGTVKVADFGIARALASSGLTTTGTLIGSVHYLAPEIVDGREATPASDQYAVGVVIFELLTGRKPLPADSPMAVALRHAREPIPPPSQSAEVPAAVDEVVARATAPDPSQRYPDVAGLAAALRAAVPGGPVPVIIQASDDRDGTLIIPSGTEATAFAGAADALRFRRQPGGSAWRWLRGVLAQAAPRLRLGGLVLLALILLGMGGWLTYDRVIAPVRAVPALEGSTQEEAEASLAEFGLAAEIGDPVSSLEVPAGGVVAQDPEAGTALRSGGTVTLNLSSGPQSVIMPSVLGRTRDEALAILHDDPYRFTVRVDEEFSDTVPAGQVQAQAPDAGEELEQGAESGVVINVSLGVEQVTVPDLSGRERDEAAQLLQERGLAGSFSEDFNDEQRAGRVVQQSPAPDSRVDKGSTVEVVVSRGSASVEVPDVLGQRVERAQEELAEVGLEAEVTVQPVPRLGPIRLRGSGRVAQQDPEGGATAQRGDSVRLLVFEEEDNRGRNGGDDD
ncbi:MAG: Stk1 family PASTA domain-containing Ser/Thr kinase [Nitriliruptorales bacterium]|nr:Stk1 family PASTA domain-containing Ser/Thr kinase [Nitriliruptorales bacterium]